MRHAVSLLVSEGLVQHQGQGHHRHVHPHQPQHLELWRIHRFLRARNEKPVTTVLSQSVVDAATGPQLRLVRARGVATENGTKFLNIDTSLLRLDRYPGLEKFDFEGQSLYQILREHYEVVPVRSELMLSVAVPSELTRDRPRRTARSLRFHLCQW